MPAAECGFPQSIDPSPAEALVENGPTLWIDIEGYRANPNSAGAMVRVPALIDTGANLNAIDDAWAQQSHLPIVDRAYVLVNGQIAYDGSARALEADAALQARLLGVVQQELTAA